MTYEARFKKVFDALRKNMKGTRNLGTFACEIFDMGLKDDTVAVLERAESATDNKRAQNKVLQNYYQQLHRDAAKNLEERKKQVDKYEFLPADLLAQTRIEAVKLERLEFARDGGMLFGQHPVLSTCPVCEQTVPENLRDAFKQADETEAQEVPWKDRATLIHFTERQDDTRYGFIPGMTDDDFRDKLEQEAQ
ncbi:hypothetical protein [Schaalia sp. lx-260]|uniref:hypothetical protein n=1 Tax=Schaalia sp. lx-260 TaxID=2899082 RepID=UPI001E62C994|nr:hypothetical protein [Schaalia sp. lx-260]MCD4549928.1 hypothetical protein [Schaalia sp. lx-260]